MGNAYSLKHLIEEPEKPYGIFDEKSDMIKEGYGVALYNWTRKDKKFQMDYKPATGEDNLVQIFLNSIKKYAKRHAAGYRTLQRVHKVNEKGEKAKDTDTKTFEKLQYENKYNYLSYAEWGKRVLNLAKGLKEFCGIDPATAYKNGEKVVIFWETQMDWMVAAFASWCLGIPIVTVYATLGWEGAWFAINQTGAKYVVADARLLNVLKATITQCPTITHIMTLGSEIDESLKAAVTVGGKVKVEQIKNVLAMGEASSVEDITALYSKTASPSNYAVYMYTSGTTGSPKGVIITHANLVACVASVDRVVGPIEQVAMEIKEQPVYLAYLPLAHIMEIMVEIKLYSMGAVMCYGSPHTLTENGVKLKRPESESDAALWRPHLFVAAPAVLDKVYNGMTKKIEDAGGYKKMIAGMAFSSGERNYERGGIGANSMLNGIAMKPAQKLLGGRCIAILTGSAPLSADIQKFCQTWLCAPVRQGYGLTETCAASCVSEWCDNTTSTVGPPINSAIIRLADWKDGNYEWADKDKPDIGVPRGEVLIGGPMVCEKYFEGLPGKEDPWIVEKNKTDFITLQGVKFFRTGDIGQISKDGCLQIIDRKKDLWKGPQGEYVALSKVEGVLKLHPVIEMPMMYGKTGGSFPILVLCADKGNLIKFAKEECGGLEGTVEELTKNKDVNAKLLKSIQALCKENGLIPMEFPAKIAFSPELWTPENELLTTTMKLKRPQITQFCKKEIDAAYA